MNTSYEKVSFYNNFFGGSIDGDNIVSTDYYGNKQVIGVTNKKHQETLELLSSYYDKLVELGVIEKEKTPEDIAKEQQEMMQTLILQMKVMQDKLESLQQTKGETNGYKSNSKIIDTDNGVESNTTEQPINVNRKGKGDIKYCKQSNRGITESEC
jgi:hypothetical protein